MEAEQADISDAYWRYHRLSTGNREESLPAEASSEAADTIWDTVHYAPMPAILTSVDELLAHPSADAGLASLPSRSAQQQIA